MLSQMDATGNKIPPYSMDCHTIYLLGILVFRVVIDLLQEQKYSHTLMSKNHPLEGITCLKR